MSYTQYKALYKRSVCLIAYLLTFVEIVRVSDGHNYSKSSYTNVVIQ